MDPKEQGGARGIIFQFEPLVGIILVLLAADLFVVVGWFFPMIYLSENQVLYVFSSQAQVVAAVYGLTITGYIFRSNQYDRLEDKDETLKDVLDKIKGRQHVAVSFITILSISSIFCSLLAIMTRELGSDFVNVLAQNVSGVFFVAVLIFVGVFVREAMLPDQIERASNDLKMEVEVVENFEKLGGAIKTPVSTLTGYNETSNSVFYEGSDATGDTFAKFMSKFNAVEKLLERYAKFYRSKKEDSVSDILIAGKEKKTRRFLSNQAVIKEMMENGVIPSEFGLRLLNITRYRNALVHGSDFNVPVFLIDEVEGLYSFLYSTLNSKLEDYEFGFGMSAE